MSEHAAPVSAISLSSDGSIIASGECTHIGFVAQVIVWDFESKEVKHRLSLHKGGVAAVSFSRSAIYLATLGGRDDRQLVVWDIQSGIALCSTQAHTEVINDCAFFNKCETSLLTCGSNHVKIWTLNAKNKLECAQVSMGSLKRNFTTAVISNSDALCYCGTHSGDIVEIDIVNKIQKRTGPLKTPFPLGVTALRLIPNGDLLAGTGEGIIAKVALSSLRVISTNKDPSRPMSAINSIALTPDGTHFFTGAASGSIHFVNSETLDTSLRYTCVTERINAIAFPHDLSDVFATAAGHEIKLWNSKSKQEILSINVDNTECYCIDFSLDGKSIVSGWSDGKIRSFTPQSGTLLFAINDAHKEGVTVIKILSDCTRIFSGGMKGEVRMWKLSKSHQELVVSMKEHKGRIWSIAVRTDDNLRAVTASADGSCIVWDLDKKVRVLCISESTMFRCLTYHPDFSQIVTVASDKRITYYDVFDGQPLRIMEGNANVICTSKSGSHLIVAGQDGMVRLIDYDEGVVTHTGLGGHSVEVTALAVAPNQSFIVSGGADGGIFFWTIDAHTLLKNFTKSLCPHYPISVQ